MPGENNQSKCYLFCTAAFHSGYTASHIIRATISLHGCLGDCYLNKEHSFLLLKEKSFIKVGGGGRKWSVSNTITPTSATF